MTDIYKYILPLVVLSSSVYAQDYRPPSLDFETPVIVPAEPSKPTKNMQPPEQKPVTKPMPPKQSEEAKVKTVEKPKPAKIIKKPDLPAVKPAESKKAVQPESVKAEPLEPPVEKKAVSADDVSLVLTYDDSSSRLTQAQIGRLKGMLDDFKAKGQFNIHAYANTTDSGNVGLARSLSLSRALTVREWFMNNGVKPENMTIRALGQARLGSDKHANSVEIFSGPAK